ncbi:MAG TPA: TadE family protein [Bryobacterales bacterium]|nr:TadE family protein [Bryobacterales bacterium]
MPRHIADTRKAGRKGSAFVEGALVLGIVLFTLIGIVDVGQVLVMHQGIVERVRAGARYAVVNPYDTNAITNVVLYNTPTPASGSKPLLNLDASLVTVNSYNPLTPEARIEVRVDNYPFYFFSPLIAGRYTARPIVADIPVEGQGASISSSF